MIVKFLGQKVPDMQIVALLFFCGTGGRCKASYQSTFLKEQKIFKGEVVIITKVKWSTDNPISIFTGLPGIQFVSFAFGGKKRKNQLI